MDYAALANEINTDPLELGYATAGGDAAIAGLLNISNSGYTANNPMVSLTSLGIWAAKTGVRATVEQAALNNASPVQGPCLAIRDLLVTMSGPPFDIGNADNQAMVAALVETSVMTAAQQAELLALGNKTPASRAEVLFGPGAMVSAYDVRVAMGRAS
jgi:hypothetical protein